MQYAYRTIAVEVVDTPEHMRPDKIVYYKAGCFLLAGKDLCSSMVARGPVVDVRHTDHPVKEGVGVRDIVLLGKLRKATPDRFVIGQQKCNILSGHLHKAQDDVKDCRARTRPVFFWSGLLAVEQSKC